MAISDSVYNQLVDQDGSTQGPRVIKIAPNSTKAGATIVGSKTKFQNWTQDEHERFLEALERYPKGPWKSIADHIQTKTARQAMTHAQKYRQKIQRRQRGLQRVVEKKEQEHRSSDLGPREKQEALDAITTSPYQDKLSVLAQSVPTPVAAPAVSTPSFRHEACWGHTASPTSVSRTWAPSPVPTLPSRNLPSLAQILRLEGTRGQESVCRQGYEYHANRVHVPHY